jgi:hypothetical protein
MVGLTIASKIRPEGTTQIVFTIAPGPKGNINMEQFRLMVELAQRLNVLLNVNPLFGVASVGTKELCNAQWDAITKKEKQALSWLVRQPCVNRESLRKLQFLLSEGGNDIGNRTCRAAEAVLTIAPNGRVLLPCLHNIYTALRGDSIKSVLGSAQWQESLEKAGRYEGMCERCIISCNIVPSLLLDRCDNLSAWESALSGI